MSRKLNEAKVGDTVIYSYGLYSESLSKIAKITPSGLIKLEDGSLYNQRGDLRGDHSYSRGSITLPTEDELKKFRKDIFTKNTLRKLRDLKKIKSYEIAKKFSDLLEENDDNSPS